MRSVRIVDTTLTAGQGTLWHGAMTSEMFLPVLPCMDRAGFEAIELVDPFVFDSCVRGLGENPWIRIRLAAKRLTRTPTAAWIAGRYLFGSAPATADLLRRAIHSLAYNGISRLGCYDPLNDLAELKGATRAAKDARLSLSGGIVFALGTPYDDAYFCERARGLAELGCDAVALLDFSGTFHPERARELIPALRDALGEVPLELRTQCRSGRAEIACFAALESGATTLHTASEPVAGGGGPPSTDFFAEHLAREGYQSGLDHNALASIRDYFEGVADYWRLPKAAPVLYDAAVDRHQLPAGLEFSLDDALRRYGRTEFLEEVASVREHSGNPPMAPPTAVLVCLQAERNLQNGLRGSACSPAEPMHEDTSTEDESDENRVTAAHFSKDTLRDFAAAQRKIDRSGWDVFADTPIGQLLGELDRRPWIKEIRVQSGSLLLETGADLVLGVAE